MLYNLLHRSEEIKDPIEVYFDNQIGIIEVATEATKEKKKKPTEMAEGATPYGQHHFDILAIIAARNEQEAKTGSLIRDFDSKIKDFFDYIKMANEGERLIVKMKSRVSEDEIYDDFGKIYRRYKAFNRQQVGDYFFKEMDDLVNKLCDDFEKAIRKSF
jgi:type I restriction enzyme R subunit